MKLSNNKVTSYDQKKGKTHLITSCSSLFPSTFFGTPPQPFALLSSSPLKSTTAIGLSVLVPREKNDEGRLTAGVSVGGSRFLKISFYI